jgi:hypothetical protein
LTLNIKERDFLKKAWREKRHKYTIDCKSKYIIVPHVSEYDVALPSEPWGIYRKDAVGDIMMAITLQYVFLHSSNPRILFRKCIPENILRNLSYSCNPRNHEWNNNSNNEYEDETESRVSYSISNLEINVSMKRAGNSVQINQDTS